MTIETKAEVGAKPKPKSAVSQDLDAFFDQLKTTGGRLEIPSDGNGKLTSGEIRFSGRLPC